MLLHSYDGGGVTIQGPSVLVRKQFAQKFSVSANHYVDKVNSASIDVVTTASPYTEERTQHSVGLDYLHDRWMMNIGFTNSEENDYAAETFNFGISQDIFGDLTTVSLGYSLGNDTVGRRGDANFSDEVQRQQYRLGAIADPDEEPVARPVVRDDHRRRLLEQSVSTSTLSRYDYAAGL